MRGLGSTLRLDLDLLESGSARVWEDMTSDLVGDFGLVWFSERLSFDFLKPRIEKERSRNLGRLLLDLTFLRCPDLVEFVGEIGIGGIGIDFKKSRS